MSREGYGPYRFLYQSSKNLERRAHDFETQSSVLFDSFLKRVSFGGGSSEAKQWNKLGQIWFLYNEVRFGDWQKLFWLTLLEVNSSLFYRQEPVSPTAALDGINQSSVCPLHEKKYSISGKWFSIIINERKSLDRK